MSREQFLEAVQRKSWLTASLDPVESIQTTLAVAPSHIEGGEMKKVMHSFLHDMQSLFPAFAAATC